jgi:hypothetical protein
MGLYLTNIDLNKNSLLNAVIQPLSSAPGSPAEGQIYENTTSHTLQFYSGSAFVVLGRLDQITAPTAAVAMNAQKITGLADPTSAQDAATKNYVDLAVNGLSWKTAVRAASTANVVVASGLVNAAVIDGVTLATGDRVLLKAQTLGQENGIYIVAVSGAASRSVDNNTAAEVLQTAVFVEEGTTLADTAWVLNTNAPITLGTTVLTFAQFGAGSTYTGSTGVQLVGNDFRIENSGVLTVAHGGTGAATLTSNAVLLGNGTSAPQMVTGTADQVLVVPHAGTAPAFGQVDLSLSAAVKNALTVTNGGTGAATLTNHGVLIGAGTGIVTQLGVAATGAVLLGVTGADPAFGSLNLTLAATVGSSILGVANGGTGLATLTVHTLQVGAGTSTPVQLAVGTTGQVLRGVTGADPAFGNIDLANAAAVGSTILAVPNGGTGLATLTIHTVQVGNGASTPTQLAVGATNTVLRGNTGADPSFGAIDISTAVVTGLLPILQGGTGASTAGGARTNLVVPSTYNTTVGDGAATSYVITHSLGTRNVVVQVYSSTTPWAEVNCDISMTSTTTITLAFAVAPTAAQYTVVVIG